MYLYVIKEHKLSKSNKTPSMLKIGVAKTPSERIRNLQTANPSDLKILHLVKCSSEMRARELEGEFHRRLSQFSIRGEWFRGDAIGRFVKQMGRMRENGMAIFCGVQGDIAMWEIR